MTAPLGETVLGFRLSVQEADRIAESVSWWPELAFPADRWTRILYTRWIDEGRDCSPYLGEAEIAVLREAIARLAPRDGAVDLTGATTESEGA